MRFTEQELREFLERQRNDFAGDMIDCEEAGMDYDYAYASGAEQAYAFVLRFLDEHKAEENK